MIDCMTLAAEISENVHIFQGGMFLVGLFVDGLEWHLLIVDCVIHWQQLLGKMFTAFREIEAKLAHHWCNEI